MIGSYPEGSGLTILSTHYTRPRAITTNSKKYGNDVLTIVAKDPKTGKKVKEEILNPEYTFFMANDDVYIDPETDYFFIEQESVHPVTTKYRDVEKTIAEIYGCKEQFYDNIKTGNRSENSKLHMLPGLFMSNMNIEDYYRMKFSNTYTNSTVSIDKAYFDIEARTRDMAGDFPLPGECPIDAVTIILEKQNIIFTLLLRDSENQEQIADIENQWNKGNLKQELKDYITDSVGGKKYSQTYGIDKFKYEWLFYNEDEEIHLIQDLFYIINKFQPDFCLAWNMAFDMPYIIQRIVNLGYNPPEIICHPDFKYPYCYYYIDEKNANEFAERTDHCDVASYTVFLDQMIQFASIRKGQSKYTSYKLDYIGGITTKVHKLDYHNITNNLQDLSKADYKIYVFYNILDTIVQKCIESKVNDIDYVFNKALENYTRYSKVHRNTVYLTNRATGFFMQCGYIIGNNRNLFNEKPEEKFAGAYVANPLKITDYAKMKINDRPVNIFDNLNDFDYTRLYPSVLQENNAAPNTQIGKVIIEDQVHSKENPYSNPKYNRGGQFIEDFQSANFLEFCSRWLHLASYKEILEDIEYYNNNILYIGNNIYSRKPVVYIKGKIKPMIKYSKKELVKPFVRRQNMPSKELEDLKNDYNR